MASNSSTSDAEWNDFMHVALTIISRHPDRNNFLETIASYLGDNVVQAYNQWKTNLDGGNATIEMRVRYVIGCWRTTQENSEIEYLVNEFCKGLKDYYFASELCMSMKNKFKVT